MFLRVLILILILILVLIVLTIINTRNSPKNKPTPGKIYYEYDVINGDTIPVDTIYWEH